MQIAQDLQLPGGQTISGPLPAGKFTNLASVVTNALPIIFSVAGIILLAYLVWAWSFFQWWVPGVLVVASLAGALWAYWQEYRILRKRSMLFRLGLGSLLFLWTIGMTISSYYDRAR